MRALGWILLSVYMVLGFCAGLSAWVAALVLRWTGSGDPCLLEGRLGWGVIPPRPQFPRVWVHGASLGEVGMLRDLAPLLLAKNLEVAATATTRTGTRSLAEIPNLAWSGILPLDSPLVVRGFAKKLKPGLLVLLETEIWPALIECLSGQNIPILIVNGRVSERGYRRYRLIRPLLRVLLSQVTLCLARSKEDLDRYIALGLDPSRGRVSGDLKLEAQASAAVPAGKGLRPFLSALGLEKGPVLVAGSIHPGEGQVLAEAFRRILDKHPETLLVAVPRHLERAGTLALEFEKAGLETAYKSQGRRPDRPKVVLWDAYGELVGLYGEATAAIIGGSFIPHGGQNPLEAARLGIPAVFGPHMENFGVPTALLRASGGAIQVEDALGLARVLEAWLDDESQRRKAGEAARAAVLSGAGALQAAAEAAASLVKR